MAKVRAARAGEAGEAGALTALVMRSKAHWGYDADFLAACAPQLCVREGELAARRVVVAENARGELLGVASLEDLEGLEGLEGLEEDEEDGPRGPAAGDGPWARLGLLFVEPSAIGLGIGRLLYRDAVRRAAALGFRRLLIEADPHAAGFYQAMGAARRRDPGPDGLVRFEVAPVPLAGWARAWTGGVPAVHVGNVAEFNAQFADASLDREQRAAHDYACLAAFYSPCPAALVLPRAVPPGWVALVGRQLGWGPEVEVYDGLVERGPGLSDAVRARPALAERVTGRGLPLVPWGRTGPYARLAGLPWRPRELRYESKSAAHELFGRILAGGGHPGITLPAQWRATTRRAAARLLAGRARAGESTVLKSEHGVGGSGTTVVTPARVREAGGARAVLRGLPRGPLLLEEYVQGPQRDADGPRDLTYDGFVDGAGRAHEVGAAVMDVADGGYRGATVGPGVVPARLAGPLLAFGAAVGRELAACGYRGWFDVDFVADAAGRLAPTEANLRLTGPSAAFMVAARLDELRGAGHLVRIADRVELGARLPDAQLEEVCADLARGCAELGAVFVPAIPTGAFDPAPWLGILVAARGAGALDAAEALVRERALAAGAGFGGEFGAEPGAEAGVGRAPGAARGGQSSKSKGLAGFRVA
ncbi:GNAT family N-acetyltransferase [Streptomyces sp. NBC_00091]|uniref:GNAT family N-acetyltransferase n=1 Tax=Streptomyces sp. NBC_00091 TaxID=2975648 RepID=UPI00224DA27A|nr:GNAT family N-acetyltransferase [Streptomyces sp. NBC_00091]MCX5380683.1 GNAT family N-acetyltransferase [Streptomyces sp. NBC_00091]